jgi:hypothetical protein
VTPTARIAPAPLTLGTLLTAAVLVLIGWLTMTAPVAAQNTPADILRDTMIQSGDYDSFQIQGPRAGIACQEACNSDTRCKAWTYIRPVSQCRLKFTAGLPVKNGCCIAGYKRKPAAVATPDQKQQQVCADYADAATKAQDSNLQQGCGLTGPRWTTSYRDHYAYCLRSPQDVVADETAIRADEISRCTQSASGGIEAKCDHFVRATMVQIASAQKAGCAVDAKDPRWAPDAETHARACRAAPNRILDDAVAERERQLAACFDNAGKQEATCSQYATTAITQFQQNLDSACGFSGPRWHASKARHYQSCLSANLQTRASEQQARQTELTRCVQQAARAQRCNEYVKTAVTAAIRSENIGCNLDGPGVRWSLYRDDHLAFCQTAPDAALRGEDAARQRELTRCQSRLQEVNGVCDVYAKRSNRLSEINVQNECGGEGDPWSTDYQDHYSYCLGANIEDRQDVLQAKRRQIAQCSNDRGFTLRLEF